MRSKLIGAVVALLALFAGIIGGTGSANASPVSSAPVVSVVHEANGSNTVTTIYPKAVAAMKVRAIETWRVRTSAVTGSSGTITTDSYIYKGSPDVGFYNWNLWQTVVNTSGPLNYTKRLETQSHADGASTYATLHNFGGTCTDTNEVIAGDVYANDELAFEAGYYHPAVRQWSCAPNGVNAYSYAGTWNADSTLPHGVTPALYHYSSQTGWTLAA